MGSELMHQILNPSTDPYFNIALEEYLITQTDDSSEWFMPVSYTHLDVYKRQYHRWPGSGSRHALSLYGKTHPAGY